MESFWRGSDESEEIRQPHIKTSNESEIYIKAKAKTPIYSAVLCWNLIKSFS